jgi:hypothetical protein
MTTETQVRLPFARFRRLRRSEALRGPMRKVSPKLGMGPEEHTR